MATDTRAATGAAGMASSARHGESDQGQPHEHEHQGKRRGHIVSHAPGRMRVRLHEEHRSPAALEQIERDLRVRDGVESVATNARTGSVLVHYDHHALSKDDLKAMLYDVGLVARDLLGADQVPEDLGGGVVEHSTTATGLLDALTDLDRRLSDLTGGKLDVKLLVPAGLGLLALRQVATSGLGLAEVPGYVLLWYTFDSFYKLHQRRSVNVVEKAAEHYLDEHPEAEHDDTQDKSAGA
jgi:hypothetical protein